jgi:hypothetical protein
VFNVDGETDSSLDPVSRDYSEDPDTIQRRSHPAVACHGPFRLLSVLFCRCCFVICIRSCSDVVSSRKLGYDLPGDICSGTSSNSSSSLFPQPFPFSRLTKLLFRGVSFLTARPKAPLWVAGSSCLRGGCIGYSVPNNLLSFRYLNSKSCIHH